MKGSEGAGERGSRRAGLCHSERSEESRGGERGLCHSERSEESREGERDGCERIYWYSLRMEHIHTLLQPSSNLQPPNRQVNAGRQEGVPCLPAIVYCLTAGKWPADIANHNNVAELYILAMVTVIETRGYFCL